MNLFVFLIQDMVPSFVRVSLILKKLVEDKVNSGVSNINLTHYILKAALDIIGSVGMN